VDLVAPDVNTLVRQLDGRKVTRFDGSVVTLSTAGAPVARIEMRWQQRVLSAVAHPQIAYLLLSLGTLGLTIELWNPGAVLPGVVGGLCLLLAFFGLSVLPVNYAGLALLAFGLVLLVLEIKVASFGLLAAGGITSLLFGSLMLFDTDVPALSLSLRFVLPLVLGFASIVLFLVHLGVQAQRRPATTGTAGMLRERGTALTALGPGLRGQVSTHGEVWSAVAEQPIDAGAHVRVIGVDGLTLRVVRHDPDGKAS
jgi:membrane-bound serine protease (ClpP class)